MPTEVRKTKQSGPPVYGLDVDPLPSAVPYSQMFEIGLGQSFPASRDSEDVKRRMLEALAQLRVGPFHRIEAGVLTPTIYRYRTRTAVTSDSFESERPEFARSLAASFLEEPVESGVQHPAEASLRYGLKHFGPGFFSWLREKVLNGQESAVSVGLLRCLGRIVRVDAGEEWALDLARQALKSADIEIRDAAIRALEYWRGVEARQILASHHEPVSWLSDYARRVLKNLERTEGISRP